MRDESQEVTRKINNLWKLLQERPDLRDLLLAQADVVAMGERCQRGDPEYDAACLRAGEALAARYLSLRWHGTRPVIEACQGTDLILADMVNRGDYKRAEAEIAAGRVVTHDELKRHLGC